ncbi:MAG: class I SAM-dependent methyltransferase [Micrococcales bacterium]|nr:class I SAM-dependent methyltransferase [Micrococcales bacterium]
MQLRDVEALASPPGRLLLASLPEYDPALAAKISQGLKQRGIDPSLVAAALTQSRLRLKATDKFGPFASGLMLTDQGLQQATRLNVAAHRAGRYRAAGITHVVDLTCGIGADAMALAALGLAVTGYEIDPVTAAVARANLEQFDNCEVIQQDALTVNLDKDQAILADPSRRQGQRRLSDPATFAPPLDWLLELRHRRPLGLKLAPGLPHALIPAEAEAQWVSVDGDVVEASLYFGPLRQADQPGRTALVIKRGQAHRLGPDPATQLETKPLDQFIYEPDGAIIRASLMPAAAAQAGLAAGIVAPRIAYMTAAQAVASSPFLTGYEVLDHFGFQLKRLRQYLRARQVGQLTIKKRGTAVQPAELRHRLDLKGSETATIILTRLGQQQSVILVRPISVTQSEEGHQ